MRFLTRERRLNYVRRLKRQGIEVLGHGFNSHVFQHPENPDVAVKVVDAGDRVYLNFARWAIKNKHNPFVPRIHEIVMIDCINNHGYALVFLEKLEDITKNQYDLFLEELNYLGHRTDLCVDDVEHARDHVESDELRVLLHYLLSKPKSLDLHQANFMMRGNQVVIIDPFAGG